jgi:hypothetical protein
VSCRHPQLGAADTDQLPRPGDPYVTWRNPFVYFNAIISAPDCAANDVDLDQLATDLQKEKTTPTFSYIAPSPCDDGSVQPCITGGQGGLPPLDAFLQSVVPEIEQSPAYKDNGLIAITFDEAPQTGPSPDTTGYNNPTYPNLATTAPATAMDALFRWASAFAQASDIAGLNLGPTTTTTTSTTSSTSTGSTGTSTTGTGTSSTGTSSSSTGTSSTGTSTSTSTTTTTSTSTTTTDTSTTPITTPITTPTTTPTSTTTTSTTSSSTAPPGSPSPGGGQVGLLLISPTIKPGCNDLVDSFNHYSLLASFETLFGLDKLGYAKDAIPFDASVFNCHH